MIRESRSPRLGGPPRQRPAIPLSRACGLIWVAPCCARRAGRTRRSMAGRAESGPIASDVRRVERYAHAKAFPRVPFHAPIRARRKSSVRLTGSVAGPSGSLWPIGWRYARTLKISPGAGISCLFVTPSGHSFRLQPSMVRKGSTVRVRQRALGFVLLGAGSRPGVGV
jgi:hypothetical protein